MKQYIQPIAIIATVTAMFFTLRSNTRSEAAATETSITTDNYDLQSFDLKLTGKSRFITWSPEDQSSTDHYELQRTTSPDGTFETIYMLTPIKVNSPSYSYSDDMAMTGNTIYYRIATVGKDGYARFSKVLSIRTDMNDKLTLYPNPAIDNINISFGNEVKRADVRIVSQNGRIMNGSRQNFSGNTLMQDISQYPGGVYYVQVNTPEGTRSSTFIKKPR